MSVDLSSFTTHNSRRCHLHFKAESCATLCLDWLDVIHFKAESCAILRIDTRVNFKSIALVYR